MTISGDRPLSPPPWESGRPDLTIGSLCTGYGGLDMAVQAVLGGTLAWVADPDPGAAAVLAHHWPDVPNLRDITDVDWTGIEPVDVICGGYPCQPFSYAGHRKGADDERHIWPYIGEAIRVLRPGLVFLENVAGHLTLGFGRVLGDLAEAGYDAEWTCLRASDVGAAHRRERVFILAQDTDSAARHERRVTASGQAPGGRARADAGGRGGASAADAGCDARPQDNADIAAAARSGGTAADANRDTVWEQSVAVPGRGGASGAGQPRVEWGPYEPAIRRWESVLGRPAPRPTEPGRTGERLSPAFVEWLMGLAAGHVTAVPGLSRNQMLKLLGNGVVWQQGAAALAELERRAAA